MVAVIFVRYGRDGSFWLDEASVALSFRDLSWGQVFEPLIGSQSFPRWYFLLIKTMKELFGYETYVLRFLPMCFGVAAAVLILRLHRIRFANAPLLLAAAVFLNLIPASFYVYSAFLKQYSFDVFLAILPFTLSDSFYEKTLGRGEERWRIALLTLPCALSYTFVIALLGRVVGWYMGEIRRRGFAIHLPSAGLVVLGIAFYLGCLYVTDLRFTLGQDAVQLFHSDYILSGNWDRNGRTLLRLAIGWYTGRGEFHVASGVPMWFLRSFPYLLAIGMARILWDALGRGQVASREAPDNWGSRSLGSATVIVGLLMASPIMGYPVADGRMTLFAFVHLQIILLEGVSFLCAQLEWRDTTRPLALALSVALAVALGPAAFRNATQLIVREPPSNIRPVLPRIHEFAELPVLISVCSSKQVATLPGGLGGGPVIELPLAPGFEAELPFGRSVLVLNAYRVRPCRKWVQRIVDLAVASQVLHGERDTVELLWVQLPDRLP